MQIAHHILLLLAAHVSLDKTTWQFILDEIYYQAEHAVRDYYFVMQRPSTIAIAAMLNAILFIDKEERRAVLSALSTTFIMKKDLDSIEMILDTKRRLFCLVCKSGT